MKETYENLQVLIGGGGDHHLEHQWNVCANLNVVAMLTVMQGGYTKFCCSYCEWDSRARDCHYRIKMATPFKNTRPEECDTSCFKGQVKNPLTANAYQAGFDKCTCERHV